MANEEYWSVDLPELSQEGAALLVERAGEFGVPDGGSAVDPRSFLTLHMDRETAATLAEGLRAAGGHQPGVGLLGIVEEWLDTFSQ